MALRRERDSQGAPITNEILLQILSLEKLNLGLSFRMLDYRQ